MTAVLSQTPATAKAAPLILLMIIFIDGTGTALLLPMLLDPGDPAGWFSAAHLLPLGPPGSTACCWQATPLR